MKVGQPPDWEREMLEKQSAAAACLPALNAGRAVLSAYDHGVLSIDPRYLAETLRMVLDAAECAMKQLS